MREQVLPALSPAQSESSRMKNVHRPITLVVLGIAAGFSANVIAVDETAAQQLARQSNCLKCHAVDKKKEGPSYHDVAAKYKGKPEARARLVTHITSGEKVKFEDGHEEDHAIVKTKDPEKINNLIDWILAQ
jgi:cytochrome c